jgi:hypothetical protein
VKTERTLDRSKWVPGGPWDNEPDRAEWRHEGLPCLMVRGPVGAWCGYVAVPPGHPWHAKHADDVDADDVHGGLTYSGACSGHICHVPEPGETEAIWWLGFDTAHAFDFWSWSNRDAFNAFDQIRATISPDSATVHAHGAVLERYRDFGYVKAEVERLAEQAAALQAEPVSPEEGARRVAEADERDRRRVLESREKLREMGREFAKVGGPEAMLRKWVDEFAAGKKL